MTGCAFSLTPPQFAAAGSFLYEDSGFSPPRWYPGRRHTSQPDTCEWAPRPHAAQPCACSLRSDVSIQKSERAARTVFEVRDQSGHEPGADARVALSHGIFLMSTPDSGSRESKDWMGRTARIVEHFGYCALQLRNPGTSLTEFR